MNNVITLNDQNVCVGVKQVKDGYVLEVNESFSDTYDDSIVGKTYVPETGEYVFTQAQIEEQAREWRNVELSNTDVLATLPDYPNTQALLAYRQALRDWPSTPEFPNTKPEM